MTADPLPAVLAVPGWRQNFVEELGVLAFDAGVPRATVRVRACLVVCDPSQQSAAEIQNALRLTAAAVRRRPQTLIGIGMPERATHSRATGTSTPLRAGGWEVALRTRLRTVTQLREVADRALSAAPTWTTDCTASRRVRMVREATRRTTHATTNKPIAERNSGDDAGEAVHLAG